MLIEAFILNKDVILGLNLLGIFIRNWVAEAILSIICFWAYMSSI